MPELDDATLAHKVESVLFRDQALRESNDLKLTFDGLTLIYKSLQAVRTFHALPPQEEVLNDTIELVDQALDQALRKSA